MEGLLHQGSADCDSWRESFLVGGALDQMPPLKLPCELLREPPSEEKHHDSSFC